jgi:hypothetical protein
LQRILSAFRTEQQKGVRSLLTCAAIANFFGINVMVEFVLPPASLYFKRQQGC